MSLPAGGSAISPEIRPLIDAICRLPELANEDAALIRRGRHLTAEFQLGIGDQTCLVAIVQGRVESVRTDVPVMRSTAFRIAAASDAWGRFWGTRFPEPGWHDILAMMKRKHLTLDGDIRQVMGNLQYIKDLMALPRRVLGAA